MESRPDQSLNDNKENIPPSFSSSSLPVDLQSSVPKSKNGKQLKRVPLQDVTHLFSSEFAVEDRREYSTAAVLVRRQDGQVVRRRIGFGGGCLRVRESSRRDLVVGKRCGFGRVSLRKSFR